MRIIWTKPAKQDLRAIQAYISEDNPIAAYDLVIKIFDKVEKVLSATPSIGRTGRILGTREFIITGTPYIVPYRVSERFVEILRVLHTARKWPDNPDGLNKK